MKSTYRLIGRVNVPNIPIMERGRFELLLDVFSDDSAIAKAKRIFQEKFINLESGESIMAYIHKDGTVIHNFPEVVMK